MKKKENGTRKRQSNGKKAEWQVTILRNMDKNGRISRHIRSAASHKADWATPGKENILANRFLHQRIKQKK